MTAAVRIDPEAWGDLRFGTLARLVGLPRADFALILVAKIWSWQTEHYTPDAPTYIVEPELIESAIGVEGAADAMVRARLAELGPDGYRIKGSEGRIEWLWKLRQTSARGGRATKRKWQNKTRPDSPPDSPPLLGDQDLDLVLALDLAAADQEPETPRESPRARVRSVALPPPAPVPAPPPEALSLEISSDWKPERSPELATAEGIAIAKGLDPATEAQRFRLYAQSKRWRRADWTAAFCKWLLDGNPASTPKRPPASPPRPANATNEHAARDRERDAEEAERHCAELRARIEGDPAMQKNLAEFTALARSVAATPNAPEKATK